MEKISDEIKLKLMDKAVHDSWRTNPIAHELKRISHRHGGRDHDIVLANAFAGMQRLMSIYAQLYEAAKNAEEKPANDTPDLV